MNSAVIEDIYTLIFEKERNAGLQKVLNDLTSREQAVLKDRYYDKLTYANIGKKLHISSERIRSIKLKALRKCRHRYFIVDRFKEYGGAMGERAVIKRKKEALLWKKKSQERQKEWELKQKKRDHEAHQQYLKEILRRQEEHDRYQEYLHKSREQRKSELLEKRNNVIEYYADQHKKCAIPPSYVGLIKKKNGEYGIGAQKNWEGPLCPIAIPNNPETYNRWLYYLIEKRGK